MTVERRDPAVGRQDPATGRGAPAVGHRDQAAGHRTTSGEPEQPNRAAAGHPAQSLAARQAALVAALTAGAPVPPGFDRRLVGAARAALLRKRAGEVARHWPLLAAGLGSDWPTVFADWAARRPTQGSLRDGWDLARSLVAQGRLPEPAEVELTVREVTWRYDGRGAPRRRRLPALRRTGRTLVVQIAGRIRVLTLDRPEA